MMIKNSLGILVFAATFLPMTALAFEHCSLVDHETTKPGIYIAGICDGARCLERLPAMGDHEVSKKQNKIVYVSSKMSANQSPVLFQLKHKGITDPNHQNSDEKLARLHRDPVKFLCDGQRDEASVYFEENTLDIPEDEYDRYHRYFYVNEDKIGRQLYQIFHVNYLNDSNACVRTDRVSKRFLFLLKNRLQNYGKFAGFLNRLPFGTKRAFAKTRDTEANQVVMKNYSKNPDQLGCAEVNVTLLGSDLEISIDNIEDKIFEEAASRTGYFATRNLKLKQP